MAEVCLTLIDPEIYGGPDTNAPTEIEIQDELPTPGIHGDENWMKRRFAPMPQPKRSARSRKLNPRKDGGT